MYIAGKRTGTSTAPLVYHMGNARDENPYNIVKHGEHPQLFHIRQSVSSDFALIATHGKYA